MITNGAIVLLLVMAFRLPDRLFFPLSAYVIPAAIFQIIAPFVSDDYFHLAAGCFNVFVLMMLTGFRVVSIYTKIIAWFSLASLVGNAVGFVLYWEYFDSVYYDGFFNVVYVMLILLTLWTWRNGIGIFRSDSRIFGDVVHGNTYLRGDK